MILPSGAGGAVTLQVGFFATEADRLAAWDQRLRGERWQTCVPDWQLATDAFADLAPKPAHATDAWIPFGGWTLLLNDTPLGTDPGLLPARAAQTLGCRAVRACADDESKLPARILEVYGPSGSQPFYLERSIAVANDGGRWVFELSGDPLAFEDLDAYEKRIKASRFTTDMLHAYLRRLGIPCDAEPRWRDAVIVERKS